MNFNKFINENNDVFQNIGFSSTLSEAYAMLYFEIDNDTIKQNIIEQCFFICMENLKKYKIPCFYLINLKDINEPINKTNSQHFIWVAKMFYDYYKINKNDKYLIISKNIIDYLKNNHIINNNFINWIDLNNKDTNVLSSIKYYAAIDIIYELDICFFNNILKTLDNHINNNIIYHIYNINTNEKYNIDTPMDSHQCMELIEGLMNIYEISNDISFYNKSIKIINDIIDSLVDDISVFSKLQVFYFIKKYNINIIKNNYLKLENFIKNIINNYKTNNNIYVYTNNKDVDNIFGYIYLNRLIKNNYITF